MGAGVGRVRVAWMGWADTGLFITTGRYTAEACREAACDGVTPDAPTRWCDCRPTPRPGGVSMVSGWSGLVAVTDV